MSVKELVRTVIYGHKSTSGRYIRYLREIGVKVGENVSIYTPTKTLIDECYPWMLTIGNNVKITHGVIILNHDYSWSVLKDAKGAVLGSSGKVTIGNNVFIGMNAIIMPNVTIGNNVVIGSGSVVTKDCMDNGVYAGNPAKRIAELDAWMNKRVELQIEEAKNLAVEYYKRYHRMPSEEIFHEYFMLFENTNSIKNKKWCTSKMEQSGNYEASLLYMKEHKPAFDNFDAFLRYCFETS